MARNRDLSAVQSNGVSAVPPVTAGKNFVINGGFDIWQRGTSISLAASTAYTSGFSADRWQTATGANQAITISRQATGDTTNLPNIQYCARYQRNSGQTGTGTLSFVQNIETLNSVPLAGKTVTFSFYARAGSNYSATSSALGVVINTGTGTDQNIFGGFTGSANPLNTTATLTTTWQRFTYTVTLATTATEIAAYVQFTPTGTASTNDYFEITGVQLEVGSTATPFSRAGGTIQGELAACQRYYWRLTSGSSNYADVGTAFLSGTVNSKATVSNPVQMRTTATSVDYANLKVDGYYVGSQAANSVTLDNSAGNSLRSAVGITLAASLGSGGQMGAFVANNSSTAYLGFSAEL